jgi:hypothetical protein
MKERVTGQTISDADDLTSDIIGATDYAYSTPPEKGFKPWHKPRKQFVRHEQWYYYINELVSERRPRDETLTYFGLPGVDLLDIRYFGTKICEPQNLKLRFLGFDKDADPEGEQQSEFNISYDEVSKTPSFDPQSEIIAYDVRDLVDDSSIAWQKTLEFGPYDVVNLDLCDGIAKEPSGMDNETYYNAISKLLAIQVRRMSPWLLFLTTRVGEKHVHRSTLDRFCKIYESNLKNCKAFEDISEAKFGIRNRDDLSAAAKDNRGLQRIVLTGLCKWFLGFVLRQAPPTTMEVKSLFGYRVNVGAKVEDMISIALRFDPIHTALPDASKLASIHVVAPDECELAAKATSKVNGLFDVDDYLASQKDIRDEMIDSMCALLELARYDIRKYRAWLAS